MCSASRESWRWAPISNIYEQPPILKGTPEEQARQLRDYLSRMVREIRQASSPEAISQITARSAREAAADASKDAIEQARRRASALKSLISKTADEVYRYVDRIVTELASVYVAKSEFGEYTETIQRVIEETARGTVESYHYTELIEALGGDLEDLESAVTMINGQIRRGVIEDPETHEQVLGIAISEELEFTGQTVDENGLTYYYLAPGQTLGLYTSTGWQFWINGIKAGWFDSRDGKLHVANVQIENSLQIGAGWIMTAAGGFGIRYIGGTS